MAAYQSMKLEEFIQSVGGHKIIEGNVKNEVVIVDDNGIKKASCLMGNKVPSDWTLEDLRKPATEVGDIEYHVRVKGYYERNWIFPLELGITV